MYVSPFEPEPAVPTAERDGDEDGSTNTLRASPADAGEQGEDEPLDEPGYGHGV